MADVKSISKFEVKKAFTVFNILFLPGDKLYISSSFRNSNSTVDWCSTFDIQKKHLGEMRRDYFYGLKEYYIKESVINDLHSNS